jgi:hypothetical protein
MAALAGEVAMAIDDVPLPVPAPKPTIDPQWTHRWVSKKVHPERLGQLCKVVRGPWGQKRHGDISHGIAGATLRVQFEDGSIMQARRFEIRRRGAMPPGRARHPGSR